MSSEPTTTLHVHKPPSRDSIKNPSVILYGSIERNGPSDWQNSLILSISDLPVTIIDPRRDDWDSSWVEDISFPKFKEQVEWEMGHAQIADIIVFYFAPGTLTPITLLELGMYASTGKAVVCCPVGFYKRGNVQIVCSKYGIPFLDTLVELERHVKQELGAKVSQTEPS